MLRVRAHPRAGAGATRTRLLPWTRLRGEHEERWQCKLHGTERACELAAERGQGCLWEWRRVGAAEQGAQMEQEVARAEGLRVHLNQGWSGRGGTRGGHGRGRARGGHAQERERNVRGVRRTEIGSDAAMEWQESATRDVLAEQADSSRGRDSGVGVRVTRGRAANIVQSAPRAVSVPTGGGGGRSTPIHGGGGASGPFAHEVHEGKYTTTKKK